MAKNKKHLPKPGIEKVEKIDDRYSLPSLLIQQTEQEVLKEYSDFKLDRENEKLRLLGGFEGTWKELKAAHDKYQDFIAANKRTYSKTFPEEIYSEWRRLRSWDKKPYNKGHKPKIFAYYTDLFVYGRLPREILPTLENLNGYIFPGIRRYKHFEFLTDKSYSDVKGFIDDVIQTAKVCSDMYEFKTKYAAKYGVPFQLSLLQDNDAIVKK